MKPWIALPAALVLATAGCGGSSSSAHNASSSSSSQAPGSTDPLAGSWQTPELPTATFVETYRRAGATPSALLAFRSDLTQAGHQHRYLIHIAGGQWVELEQHDGGTPQVGWSGTYTLTGDTVYATEPQYGCHDTYRIALTGSSLRIRLVSYGPLAQSHCGVADSWPQRSIYETAAFHRVN